MTLLTSCAFVPKVSKDQDYAKQCDMLTQKLTLSAEQIDNININIHSGNNNGLNAFLMTLGVVIPVGSLIISGSIVLVGNSLHWLEYQSTCDEGLLLKHMP